MKKIPFQFHVTISDIHKEKQEVFIKFCEQNQLKPLMIVLLEGDYINQPMFTKVIESQTYESALEEINILAKNVQEKGFVICRIKAEIFSEDSSYYPNGVSSSFNPYYECHLRVQIENQSAAEQLCKENDAHLSRNSFDSNHIKYITIREYGSKSLFDQRVKTLIKAINEYHILLIKQKLEYCIYDSNLELDRGWAL